MALVVASNWNAALTRLIAPRSGWLIWLNEPHPRAGASAAPSSARVIQLTPPPKPGDAERFSALVTPYLDDAYTFARYLTHGDAASEDIVHDAYIRALRAYPGFRGGDAKAWILTIVRNCFLTWAKTRSSGRMVFDEQAIADLADVRTPETERAAEDASALMRRLIQALPAHLSEVIVLREIEELSYREIAAILGAPIGTVMSRLARAREQLAKFWRESGGLA